MSEREPDAWERAGLRRLTYEEMIAGERCMGCGVPLITDEETERPCFCHAAHWRMAGQGSDHCCNCCPPPPISPDIREKIIGILAMAQRRKAAEEQAAKEPPEDPAARLPMYLTPVYRAVREETPLSATGLTWPTIFEYLRQLVDKGVFTRKQAQKALTREAGLE